MHWPRWVYLEYHVLSQYSQLHACAAGRASLAHGLPVMFRQQVGRYRRAFSDGPKPVEETAATARQAADQVRLGSWGDVSSAPCIPLLVMDVQRVDLSMLIPVDVFNFCCVQAKEAISKGAAAAGQLAQETMKELFGSSQPVASSSSSEQKDEQKKDEQSNASSSSSSAAGADDKTKPEDESASPATGFGERLRGSASAILREMRLALQAEAPASSALRGAPKGGELKAAETTALAHHAGPEETAWQKQWRDVRHKVKHEIEIQYCDRGVFVMFVASVLSQGFTLHY